MAGGPAPPQSGGCAAASARRERVRAHPRSRIPSASPRKLFGNAWRRRAGQCERLCARYLTPLDSGRDVRRRPFAAKIGIAIVGSPLVVEHPGGEGFVASSARPNRNGRVGLFGMRRCTGERAPPARSSGRSASRYPISIGASWSRLELAQCNPTLSSHSHPLRQQPHPSVNRKLHLAAEVSRLSLRDPEIRLPAECVPIMSHEMCPRNPWCRREAPATVGWGSRSPGVGGSGSGPAGRSATCRCSPPAPSGRRAAGGRKTTLSGPTTLCVCVRDVPRFVRNISRKNRRNKNTA